MIFIWSNKYNLRNIAWFYSDLLDDSVKPTDGKWAETRQPQLSSNKYAGKMNCSLTKAAAAAVAAMRLICLTGMKYADLMSWGSLHLPFAFSMLCSHAAQCSHADLLCDASVCKYHTHEIQRSSAREWQFLSTNWRKMSLFSVDSMRLNSTSTSFTVWVFACSKGHRHRHIAFATIQMMFWTYITVQCSQPCLRWKDCSRFYLT